MYESHKTAIENIWEINLDDYNLKLKKDLSTSRKAISLKKISRNLSIMFDNELSQKKARTGKKSASANSKIKKRKNHANYQLSDTQQNKENINPNIKPKMNAKKLEKTMFLQNLKKFNKVVKKTNLNESKVPTTKNTTLNNIVRNNKSISNDSNTSKISNINNQLRNPIKVSKSPKNLGKSKNYSKNDNSIVHNNSKVAILRNFLKQQNSFRNSYQINDLSCRPKKCRKNRNAKKRQQNKSNNNTSQSFFMKKRYGSQDNAISLNDFNINTRNILNPRKRRTAQQILNNHSKDRANKSISNQQILTKSLDDYNKLGFYKSDIEDGNKLKCSKSKQNDIRMKIVDKDILVKNISAKNSFITDYHDLINKAKQRIQKQVLYLSMNKDKNLSLNKDKNLSSTNRNYVTHESKLDFDRIEHQEMFKPINVDAPNRKFVQDMDALRSSTEEYFFDATTSSKDKFSEFCKKTDPNQNTILKNSLFARKSYNNNDCSKIYSRSNSKTSQRFIYNGFINSDNTDIINNPYINGRYTMPSDVSKNNTNIMKNDQSQKKDQESSIQTEDKFPTVSPFNVNIDEILKTSILHQNDSKKTKMCFKSNGLRISKNNKHKKDNFSRENATFYTKNEKSKKTNANFPMESISYRENMKKSINFTSKNVKSEKDKVGRENKTKKKLRTESILRESNCSVKTLEDNCLGIESSQRTFYKKTQTKNKPNSKSKTKIKLKSPVRYSLNLANNVQKNTNGQFLNKDPNVKNTKTNKIHSKRNSEAWKNKLHESIVTGYLGNVIGGRKNASHDIQLRKHIGMSLNYKVNQQSNEYVNMNSISTWRRNIMHAYDIHHMR